MIERALQQIGLTAGEIRVYIALLETGSTTTGELTKKSRISGSKIYEVLDRLIAKGLANSTTKNGVKRFEAARPERLLDYLEEKQSTIQEEKQEVQKIIPELILRQQSAQKGDVRVFTGWEGLKTGAADILHTLGKGDEYLSMGLTAQPKSWENYFNRWQDLRAKKGIIYKHLINIKYKQLYIQRKQLRHSEFRFLPISLEMPTSTEIYKNKVIINIMTPESPMAIMIESEEVAKSFRKYFYVMWGIAEKPGKRNRKEDKCNQYA